MIDRLILSAVLGTVGWHGLFPDTPQPLTPCAVTSASKREIHKRDVRQETQEQGGKRFV
jgi:hypothetical protein